jgi:hydrogenase maturation factor HypF (carbamoyltransferase family)
MNLSELYDMVKSDLEINETELDKESLNTPVLHNKYLVFHGNEKLKLQKLSSDFKILKRDKWLYYTGKMSEEELERRNWEPFDLAILKTEIDRFIDSDSDIVKLQSKIKYQEQIVNYLENVIKIVSNRQWNIRAALDWIKFTQNA